MAQQDETISRRHGWRVHTLASLVVALTSCILALIVLGLAFAVEAENPAEGLTAAFLVAVAVGVISGALYATFGRGVSRWLRELAELLMDFLI